MSVQEDSPLIRLRDVPRYLQISESTMFRLIREGKLSTVRVGLRAKAVTRKSLEQFLGGAL